MFLDKKIALTAGVFYATFISGYSIALQIHVV